MKITLITSSHKNATGISQYSNMLQRYLPNTNSYSVPRLHPALVNNPLLIKPAKSDIYHFTHQQQSIPLFYLKGKKVITVHDIYPYVSKEYNSLFERMIYSVEMIALKKATHIIADSEFTKRELITYLKLPENKITVVHLGVDTEVFKPNKEKPESYTILNVCNEVPRKNIATLIKAFALLKKELPQAKLVRIGNEHSAGLRKKLKELAAKLGVVESITWKDHVTDLGKEYNKFTLFVFPSLYEGFGLPVLEAMASGVPVICSDKTSLQEVGGNAALYFNGKDEIKLAKLMYDVLTDKNLRRSMIHNGIVHARKMTWEETARKTQEVYKKTWDV